TGVVSATPPADHWPDSVTSFALAHCPTLYAEFAAVTSLSGVMELLYRATLMVSVPSRSSAAVFAEMSARNGRKILLLLQAMSDRPPARFSHARTHGEVHAVRCVPVRGLCRVRTSSRQLRLTLGLCECVLC